MPQIFQVLRCYKCFVFQIHQTKKSNRWECKLCGEKQSVKRHYGIGTGKDCRMHVQRLNGLRGEKDENKIDESNTDDYNESENDVDIVNASNLKGTLAKNKSKWLDYIETHEEPQESNSNETMYLGEKEVVLEVMKKHKKCFSKNKIAKVTANLKTIESSKTIKDDFKTSIISNEPSISPLLENSSFINIAKPIIQRRETSISKIMPPTINKNSKWAQYNDDEETSDKKITLLSPTEVTKQSVLKDMFSLCEDCDLDNVLDI